ncbi:MAG: ATP-binding cassette domain-containing protein [Chloroflexota bacterium]|jgi:ABC-type polysaccharide/polyol phosphate transport system ATPase subunit
MAGNPRPRPTAEEVEEAVDSRQDERMEEDALAAIADAENEAPDPEEFGLKVQAPLGEIAIRAENLGIRYNLNFTKKTKLRTTFANLLDPRRRNAGHFWALRNVDFTVRRGEAVGIVGPNGSGKSTLLLALAGILQPSEGVVEVSGHVSTLLSLNAGFDAELTGRENIALAGALMGIDEQVMREITPGIIRFANIGAFIDAPLKTYSSGMRARVGFSIATAVDPDILLLDEVLQTGDNKFKNKSRRRIAEVLQTAKAVVMVTHDMSWITAFCNRAVLMDKGQIVADGDPEEIADLHEQDAAKRARQKRKAKQLLKHGKVDLVDIRRARRQGKLDQLVEGHEDDYQALKAEKQRQLQESRAKRRAAKQARKTKQQEAEAAGRRSNDGAAPARTGATTDDTEPNAEPNAEPAASGSAEPAASGSAERTPPSA